MKLGWYISIGAVLVMLIALAVSLTGYPDPPTSATGPQRLAKIDFPADLPAMFVPDAADTDAATLYEQALLTYDNRRSAFEQGRITGSQVEAMGDTLVEAMHAGKVRHGFLDQYIPLEVGGEPTNRDALEAVAVQVLDHSIGRYERGETAEAIDATRAVFVLGLRAFTHNDLLYPRYTGLRIMNTAGQQLYNWAGDESVDADRLVRWAEALDAVQNAWEPKVQIVMAVRPHIGDLLNLAQHDEDLTFRIAAIHRLGIIKFAPRHRGNRRAIGRALDQAMEDENPLISNAAHAANALTRDEMRRLH